MLETLEGMPEGVVGIRATGRVTGDDYRTVFVSALDRALEQGGKARLLYELGGDYEGYDAGGLWKDLRLGATHLTSFERIAVVIDIDWIEHAVRIFGVLIPGGPRLRAGRTGRRRRLGGRVVLGGEGAYAAAGTFSMSAV